MSAAGRMNAPLLSIEGLRVGFRSAGGLVEAVRGVDFSVALGDALGVALAAPAKPITPTQAKKLVDAAVIDAYASRPYAGVRLEPERPAEQRLGEMP